MQNLQVVKTPEQWLAEHTPARTDTALEAKLARRCGLSIDWQPAVVLSGAPPVAVNGPGDRLGEALDLVRGALTPASDKRLTTALVRLRSLVAARERDEADAELSYTAWIEELRRYPADVALQVLTEWPRRSRWWPALEEIVAQCDRLVAPRRGLLAALERHRLADPPVPVEELQEVGRLLDDLVRSLRGGS